MKGNTLNKMNKTRKNDLITMAMVVILFGICIVCVEGDLTSNLFKTLLVPICCNIILAMSLNLTVGVLGELSLGHAGFMCAGAFAGAIVTHLTKSVITSVWVRLPLAIIVGGLAAAIVGVIVGIPVLRLKGDYLAIVTLGFGEIIKNLVKNMYLIKDVNGLHFFMSIEKYTAYEFDFETKQVIMDGATGITGTPKNSTYIIGFVLVLITTVVILNFMNSRSGRAVMSIRDNRIAAESVGINITKYKLMAFVMSAFFAGVAGVLYSHNISNLQATKFDYNYSILILVFVVLGGLASMRGSVISAIILTALPELLRSLYNWRMLIYAVILIVVMLVNNNEVTHNIIKKLGDDVKANFKKRPDKGGKKGEVA